MHIPRGLGSLFLYQLYFLLTSLTKTHSSILREVLSANSKSVTLKLEVQEKVVYYLALILFTILISKLAIFSKGLISNRFSSQIQIGTYLQIEMRKYFSNLFFP